MVPIPERRPDDQRIPWLNVGDLSGLRPGRRIRNRNGAVVQRPRDCHMPGAAHLLAAAKVEHEESVIHVAGRRRVGIERGWQGIPAQRRKTDGSGRRADARHRNLREGQVQIIGGEVLQRNIRAVGKLNTQDVAVREVEIGVLQINCDVRDPSQKDILKLAVLREEVIAAAIRGNGGDVVF